MPMRPVLLPLALAAVASLASAQTASPASNPNAPTGPTTVPKTPVSFDLSAIDKSANPCDNFYQYACGNWLKQNPIPADQSTWGRFNELNEHNRYLLYTDLKQAADDPKSPLQRKYGNFFAACMNESLANQLGSKPLDPQLELISSLKSPSDLASFEVVAFQKFGGLGFFDAGVEQDQKDSSKQIAATDQGGLTLPDRDYYLNDDDRSKTLREQLHAHIIKMFTLLGDSPELARTEADDVLRIETALAKGSMSKVDRRNPDNTYHVMTVGELDGLSPSFKWATYLDGIGLSEAKTLDVNSPGYVKAVQQILSSEQLPAIQHYLRWHALNSSATSLSDAFVDEHFNFFGKILSGQKELPARWKRCTRATDSALGEAVGQDWVKQNFPPSSKDSMERLIHALEAAMAVDIKQLPWMGPATKQQAELKLKAIADKIGYPEHWRDYSTLVVERDQPLGNEIRAAIFENKRNIEKFGKPVDKSEWLMTPPTVNAYYDPPQNNINFPAGILQPPFFSPTEDPAVNFGAIGVVIGHEMTHGFDDEGAKYDLNGNVRTWFTPADLAAFHERTECTANEYDKFEVAPGQHLNGHLTLGENTADNGGLRIAFRALQDTLQQDGNDGPGFSDGKKDGYTPDQRFFISFAQVWCNNTTEQAARLRARTDPHSSGEWRTNGSVQNFEEFGKAFGCKVGDPMRPATVCRTW